MRVNEIFGPTIQGEGPHAGQRVGFLRLAECNLACSWCDTPYSWDWSRFDRSVESKERGYEDIKYELGQMSVDRVVVTGGEPLLQQDALITLMKERLALKWDIETNGTIVPKADLIYFTDLFVVSPKLKHAGGFEKKRLKPVALKAWSYLASDTEKVIFKFVCQSKADLQDVWDIAFDYAIPSDKIWILPEGADRETHLANLSQLADAVVEFGFNLSTRTHVLAWDTKRGV